MAKRQGTTSPAGAGGQGPVGHAAEGADRKYAVEDISLTVAAVRSCAWWASQALANR
jgi:hypothetical protein